jgi:hypothetical protein
MSRYIVKVICGVFTREEDMLAPGKYWTAINVYNPSREKDAKLRIHIAIADPVKVGSAVTTGPSFDVPPDPLYLEPGKALEIDCEYIKTNAGKIGGHNKEYLKGFLVIENDFELDVVAVYTAAGQGGTVVTLHTERVLPRDN